ncbi:MAG: hypothetical protein CSA15_00890 [Candidatus Delongbacteria bacterium]|nr:MAG: hypothetical protein CSA15_00890 [Candidatus Delongbacteria bacterium]
MDKYQYKKIIEINENDIMKGGILFAKYQKKLEELKCDAPLWKDHLPPLKLKTFDSEIQLVGNKTSIIPKRGIAIPIPIERDFTLPEKSPFIEFELERGDGTQEDQFFAYIKDDNFPLEEDIDCKLKLTYTYGDSSPYKLVFIPSKPQQEKKYGVFTVEWTKKSHIDLSSFPIPNYPPIYQWKDFFNYPDSNKEKDSNIIEWLEAEFLKIQNVVDYGWNMYKVYNKGSKKFININQEFIFNNSPEDEAIIFDKENRIQSGDLIKCFIIENTKRISRHHSKFIAQNFYKIDSEEESYKCFLKRSLRFPIFILWNNTFSIDNEDVSLEFKEKCLTAIENAENIISDDSMPNFMKDEMRMFLSALHKDTPQSNIQFLNSCIDDDKLFIEYYRRIAFAVSDCSENWQEELLEKVLVKLEEVTFENKQIVEYTMRILTISVWRYEKFINKFHLEEIDLLLKNISISWNEFINNQSRNKKDLGQQRLSASLFIELLIALLRLRTKKEFQNIFSPYSNQIKKLYSQLNKIKEKEITLNTRIKFKNDKNEEIDILDYTMEYLLGVVKDTSIKISSVSE